MAEKRTRNWAFVFYPESTREDWRDVLGEKGLQLAISPLHDKDKYTKDVYYTKDETDAQGVEHKAGEIKHKAGEIKKAHYHAVIVFDSVKSREQVQEIAQMLALDGTTAPAVQHCMNLRGSMRYLAHIDNPEKAQYDTAEIQTIGGLDWAYYAMSNADLEYDTRNRITAVLNLVYETGVTNFADLVDVVLEREPELFEIVRKNAYFFGNYMKTKIYKKSSCQDEKINLE